MKKLFLVPLMIVLVMGLIFGGCARPAPAPAPAPPETIELVASTSWPMPSGGGVALEAICKKLEEVTNGRLKIEIYGGGALGKAAEQYDLAVEGTADIVLTNPAYYPGRLPLHDVSELPLIFPKDSASATNVFTELHDMFPEMMAEFVDVKCISWAALTSRQIQTIKPVRTLEDLKGLKLRVTGGIPSETVELLGAVPVAMAPTEVYTALERGTVDGSLFEWEGYYAFKLHEVAKSTTMVDLATTSHLMVMNQKRYESFPPDVREAVDTLLGANASKLYAQVIDRLDKQAFDKIMAGGQVLIEISAAEKDRFLQAVIPQREKWAADMEAKGLPGKKVLESAIELSKKYK